MQTNTKSTSIRSTLQLVFITSMLLFICGISFVVFTRWYRSTEQATLSIAADINTLIYADIFDFLHAPDLQNELAQELITNEILDFSDAAARDKFFVCALGSYNLNVYSFAYGTVHGEYYGARRNEQGVIEIMRNNASTQGHSWYYAVNDDLTAGERVVEAGLFDPRTRAWYQAAVQHGGPAFSPAYTHFIMNDLTVSAAWPVYQRNGQLQGVLGTHMLLSDIGAYLASAVHKYQGYALILEQESRLLIANSWGEANFATLLDGTLQRYSIADIPDTQINQVLEYYDANQVSAFKFKAFDDQFYIHVQEISEAGIDWIVISAIPVGLLMADVVQSIRWTALLVLLALALSVIIFRSVTKRLAQPIDTLLQAAAALASGDLSSRVPVVRNDEIGSISTSLNAVADTMQDLINNLEAKVRERTIQLHQANRSLEESRERLRLILDSAAEAIYGIDVEGNCTFCNTSCIRLLGYKSQDELLGHNMHRQIHHNHSDGTPLPQHECHIYRSIRENRGTEVNDEVFWRADGTAFAVEYRSYPQVQDGQVVGAVVTFEDITDRKLHEARISYLSYHDTLTGLYNRTCFDEKRVEMDTPANLPLSVIFADLNGLKMTNDIFGHAAGDQLIKKSAEILRQSCRAKDIIARIGGDEFVILLPRTDEVAAQQVLERIRAGFSDARIEVIKCSISLGTDTKTNAAQSFAEVVANAENAMYKDKMLNRQSTNTDIINTIIEALHARSPKEKQHSNTVSRLCGAMGTALDLPEPEITKLERAGFLHDIGKIILDERILDKETLSEAEFERMQQHPATGYRILNLFDDTLDLAEYVYGHHERWDGKGYPRGLKRTQIPLIARIISVAETYDRVLNRGDLPLAQRQQIALAEISKGAGTQLDPQIAELFVRLMAE